MLDRIKLLISLFSLKQNEGIKIEKWVFCPEVEIEYHKTIGAEVEGKSLDINIKNNKKFFFMFGFSTSHINFETLRKELTLYGGIWYQEEGPQLDQLKKELLGEV